MKSPFPGMDPYIESCDLWGDFHNTLISEIHRALGKVLPQGYVARTGKRSYIVLVESEEKSDRHFEPDVAVTAPREGKSGRTKNGGSAATAVIEEVEPISLRAFIDTEFVERFIDIYELQPERRLVTSIEVLSPSNKKRGSVGWKRYLRKRQALLLGRANLVEIDLLRGGDRMPMLDPFPSSPYYLLVARQQWAPTCRVWPAHFDRPLPTIPVPLSKPDPDLSLSLQPFIGAIYELSRYAEDIDYAQPLQPPLSTEEAAWWERRRRSETATAAAPSRRRPARRQKK